MTTIDGRPADTGPIRVGPLMLDPEGFSVMVDGQPIGLTLGQFVLLETLVRHPYQAIDRQQLAAILRERIGMSDDTKATSRSVDTSICRIRGKLRKAGYDCITTMRYVGYRFIPARQR